MKGLVKGLVEDAAEQAELVGLFVGLLGLAGDLRLTHHHGGEG